MTGNTVHAAEAAYRKKRVKRIKKIIVGTAIVLLLLPTIMCLFLLVKVHSLEKQIETITKVSDSGVVKAQEKEVKTTKAPKKASTAEPTIKPTDDTTTKKVYLTFDDGPNSQYTPLLLKGLKERGVHATFFLMGKNIEGKEALVKQIQEEGHLIGNHTYNHVQLDKISKEVAKEEIETTNQKIFEITGVYPAWLRPPYGEWRKNLDFYVEMFPVLWDVDTLDWKSKNVDSIMKIVRSEVSDGAVILMHDAYQSSVDAALQIVDLLMAEEYEFVTVEELILP